MMAGRNVVGPQNSSDDLISPKRHQNHLICKPEHINSSMLFDTVNRFILDLSNGARHLTNMFIYKILRKTEWATFHDKGETGGAPVDLQDGFIHFSTAEQAAETAAKHFAGEYDLMLLACAETQFGNDLKWEPSRGGALFPHLFRRLKTTDVLWVKPLPYCDNSHQFPKEMV